MAKLSLDELKAWLHKDDDDEDIEKAKLETKRIAQEEKRLKKEEKLKQKQQKKEQLKELPTIKSEHYNLEELPESHRKAFQLKCLISQLYNERSLGIQAKITKKKLILYDIRHSSYQRIYILDNKEHMKEIENLYIQLQDPELLEIYKIVYQMNGSDLKSIIEGNAYIRKYYDYTLRRGKSWLRRNLIIGKIWAGLCSIVGFVSCLAGLVVVM